MQFDELDDVTRRYMLSEFEAEQAGGNPYIPRNLSPAGRAAFPDLMREAIRSGTEQTLSAALSNPTYWEPHDASGKRVNVPFAAQRAALTEFNTWYVRGLARRLLDEGVEYCQVYRAMPPKHEPGECSQHEGQTCPVQMVYDGHRRRYWPEPGDPTAFSIPAGPSCHHTIRRV